MSGAHDDRTEQRLAHLEELRVLIARTNRLRRVFDSGWFEAVRQSIVAAHGNPELRMQTHTAFVGYLHDAILNPAGPNLIEELDRAFDAISEAARLGLGKKLLLVADNHNHYVSTVFETLVVGRFASAGLLLQYEPVTAGGRPEAKVRLGDQEVIIEARAILDARFRRPDGAYSPDEGARRLEGKIEEKYAQLAGAGMPTLLFVALNVNLHFEDHEVRIALQTVGAHAASAMVSGIVLSADFRARRFRLWPNPQATLPLSDAAREALGRVVDLA